MKQWTLALTATLVPLLAMIHLTAQTRTQAAAAPSAPAEVCRDYEPSRVRLLETPGGHTVTYDGELLLRMDTRTDGEIILAEFKAHKTFCWVGSANKRADRLAYVHEYWKSPVFPPGTPGPLRSAAAGSAPPREDCTLYNPAAIRLTDEGAYGWLISAGDLGARLMGADTKADADILMGVFMSHRSVCYVGRTNIRPDRETYVHTYWK